jgi:hypothetical protein
MTAQSMKTGHWITGAVIIAWGLAVVIGAQTGFFRSLYPPFIAPIVAIGIAAPTAAYFMFPSVRRYIEGLGLRTLTLFHIWRIPAALLFFWYGSQGLLPETFVRHAAWGDLIAGCLALGIAFMPESRGAYWGFHLFGFADFVLAVGTGLAFTLANDPRMEPIRDLPMALIPLYGVGISGASHLMAFDLLIRGRGLRKVSTA